MEGMKNVQDDTNPKYFAGDFTVEDIDKKGQQFSNVSRFFCKSFDNNTTLKFDANVQIFNLNKHEGIYITIQNEIPEDAEAFYHYVMHGLIYKYDEKNEHTIACLYISFGGLLLKLKGPVEQLSGIPRGEHTLFCVRKNQ